MDEETKSKLIAGLVVLVIIIVIWFVITQVTGTSYVDEMVEKIYKKQEQNVGDD
jgi:uncharacterized membrane protein